MQKKIKEKNKVANLSSERSFLAIIIKEYFSSYFW